MFIFHHYGWPYLVNGKGTVWKCIAETFIRPYLSICVADDASVIIWNATDVFFCLIDSCALRLTLPHLCISSISVSITSFYQSSHILCATAHGGHSPSKRRKNEQDIFMWLPVQTCGQNDSHWWWLRWSTFSLHFFCANGAFILFHFILWVCVWCVCMCVWTLKFKYLWHVHSKLFFSISWN